MQSTPKEFNPPAQLPARVARRARFQSGRLGIRALRPAVAKRCSDDDSPPRRCLTPTTTVMLAMLAILAVISGTIAVAIDLREKSNERNADSPPSIAVATANERANAQPAPITKQPSHGSTAGTQSSSSTGSTGSRDYGGSSTAGGGSSSNPTGYVGLDQLRQKASPQAGNMPQVGNMLTSWRTADERCGAGFPAPDGTEVGQCDASSAKPCCSRYGWCGGTAEHCFCSTGSCVDYRSVAAGTAAGGDSQVAIKPRSQAKPTPQLPTPGGAPKAFLGTLNTNGLDVSGLETSNYFPPLPMTAAMVSDCREVLLLPRERALLADPTNYGERSALNDLGQGIPHDPQMIVLHETVGSAKSTINFFRTAHARDADQASYHVLIDRSGTLIRFVPDEKRAFGAGMSAFNDFVVKTRSDLAGSVNNVALHISLETPEDGRGHVSRHSGYTDAQYRHLAQQVLVWQAKYGIPFERVTTHHAVDRSRTRSDPRSFAWDKFDSYHHRAAANCMFTEFQAKQPRPSGGWGSLQAMEQMAG